MTSERIITAATVTSGEKGDGPELENLVQKSRSNGVDVDVIVGEAAYSGKDNIKMAATEDIELVSRLNPNISQGTRKDEDKTQMEFQQTDRFKILARERYKIEAKKLGVEKCIGI